MRNFLKITLASVLGAISTGPAVAGPEIANILRADGIDWNVAYNEHGAVLTRRDGYPSTYYLGRGCDAISVFGPEYIGDDPITVGQGVWGQTNDGMVLILHGTGSDTGVYNVYFPRQNIRINSCPIGR